MERGSQLRKTSKNASFICLQLSAMKDLWSAHIHMNHDRLWLRLHK
uniref:Uncharacterized protein n=1 Tax=Anguilla anguilla TaxID=7936 RepID=A0A0E9Q166_ANGAN